MVKEYPVVYIAKPKIKINFSCVFCSAKYKTTEIRIIHLCKGCNKENNIKNENYSMDAISYYLTLAIYNLKHNEGVSLRATDSYIILLNSLIDYLTLLGLKVTKNHKMVDINKKKNQQITVNEVILEKIGAIR